MIQIMLEAAASKIQTAQKLAVGLHINVLFSNHYSNSIPLGVDSITCNGQGTCNSGNSGICACDSGFELVGNTTCVGKS